MQIRVGVKPLLRIGGVTDYRCCVFEGIRTSGLVSLSNYVNVPVRFCGFPCRFAGSPHSGQYASLRWPLAVNPGPHRTVLGYDGRAGCPRSVSPRSAVERT